MRVESGPWRILLISRWDAGLFKELLRGSKDASEIHAVFLPAAGPVIPDEFQDWLERVRPQLVVLPHPQSELMAYLTSRRFPCLVLKDTGALGFRRNGPQLELVSFLNGSLGVFSYL